MKTVLITGASSGIGKETAKLFQAKGWNVIATMRNPQTEEELTKLENVKVIPCDVTNQESIKTAVAEGVATFGGVDVLVNNAGYYTLGPLEAATHEQIKRQLDTNLLGLIEVTQAVIPYFRKQKSGTIINISSIAGIVSIPLQSLYHATKWGVEGFSESLHYELRPFHIRVRIIEPGIIKTDFYGRSMTKLQDSALPEYEDYAKKVVNNIHANGEKGSSPEGVAQTIYKAAVSHRKKLRYSKGKLKMLIPLRQILPVTLFAFLMRSAMER
ncbi:MAG: SDR family oxidoreductase [Peptococcaceae bacterium]|nr:SDR family oxidoreductase [Peptococcaceae bacterium]